MDPGAVPVQVRQLHAEHVGRGLRPQPHGHEPRAVRPVSNAIVFNRPALWN